MIDGGNCTVDAITYQQYRKSLIKIPEGCGTLRKKVIWLLLQNGVPNFFFCCLYCGVGWQKIMQCSSNLQFHRGGWLCLDTGLHLRFALLSFLMYLRRYVAMATRAACLDVFRCPCTWMRDCVMPTGMQTCAIARVQYACIVP